MRRIHGAASQLAMVISTPAIRNRPPLVPTARRIFATSPRPALCPTRIEVAIARPNTPANSRNMIRLALVVAASARAPRKPPPHTELIEPLSDVRIDRKSAIEGQREDERVELGGRR